MRHYISQLHVFTRCGPSQRASNTETAKNNTTIISRFISRASSLTPPSPGHSFPQKNNWLLMKPKNWGHIFLPPDFGSETVVLVLTASCEISFLALKNRKIANSQHRKLFQFKFKFFFWKSQNLVQNQKRKPFSSSDPLTVSFRSKKLIFGLSPGFLSLFHESPSKSHNWKERIHFNVFLRYN
jgi:hypothetical protein